MFLIWAKAGNQLEVHAEVRRQSLFNQQVLEAFTEDHEGPDLIWQENTEGKPFLRVYEKNRQKTKQKP